MPPYPEPTVSAVIFNPDNKILLCRSHKWEDKWIIPGGHIEWGESMEEALIREIMEETGLKIFDIRLLGLQECIRSGKFHEQKHFIFIDYTCRTDSSLVVLNDEAEEFAWLSFAEAESYPLGGDTRALLQRMQAGQDAPDRVEIFYNYV